LRVAAELKDFLPVASVVISVTALFVSLRDRRPRLALRPRKGDWYKLDDSITGKELIFRGIVEAYNVSSRANAIRVYEFWCKREGGDWEKMESEFFTVDGKDENGNVTPFTLAPYSGAELHVIAVGKTPKPTKMQVRIRVEDLFGKHYKLEVTATQ
jgi:hypothetical protein